MTEARTAFDRSLADVNNLLEFHAEIGGVEPGRRDIRLRSINKSAIVLLCAAWESYVEDVLVEAAQAKIFSADSIDDLPRNLQKLVGNSVKVDKDLLAPLRLAGDGWRELTLGCVKELVEALNTPNARNTNKLFSQILDIDRISSNWSWHRNRNGQPVRRLDNFITLRGGIAHGRADQEVVNRVHVTENMDLVTRLADAIEAKLRETGIFA